MEKRIEAANISEAAHKERRPDTEEICSSIERVLQRVQGRNDAVRAEEPTKAVRFQHPGNAISNCIQSCKKEKEVDGDYDSVQSVVVNNRHCKV